MIINLGPADCTQKHILFSTASPCYKMGIGQGWGAPENLLTLTCYIRVPAQAKLEIRMQDLEWINIITQLE